MLVLSLGWLGCVSAQGSPEGLVAHEWGTFTAVAGPDGAAVSWHPLDTGRAGTDLPSFVYGPERLQEGLRDNQRPQGKGQSALVRMETPVIYFYTPVEQKVSVSVDFPKGSITEWYPRVRSYEGTRADWGELMLVPPPASGEVSLPEDGSDSHYYPARNVESALVRVCDERHIELERFLFYRGVGQFGLSVGGVASDETVALSGGRGAPREVMLFERRGSSVGYSIVASAGRAQRPALDDRLEDVYSALERQLTQAGLYGPEAHAMIETWKGDWFEDGLRVLYLLPKSETDALLPLHIEPKPTETVRVMVGRLELPTPEQKSELSAILDSQEADEVVLATVSERFGRFAEPWLVSSGHPRADKLLISAPPGQPPGDRARHPRREPRAVPRGRELEDEL